MAHPNVLTDSKRVPQAVAAFFKSDRPRTIDRYIDYFGGDATCLAAEEHALRDAVGEELTA
jgi:hypothetical protein